MNFTEQLDFFTQSVDEFLAKSLSDEQKKIIDFLQNNYGDGAEKIYKSAMYVFLTNNIPAKQMIVIHCFNELINLITRKNVSIFRKKFDNLINEFDFWELEYEHNNSQNGNLQKMVSKISKDTFEPLDKRITDILKISYTIKKHRPLLSKEERKKKAEKIHEIKEKAPKYRHTGDDLAESDDYFQSAVNEFNNFLKLLAEDISYLEKLGYINNTLSSKEKPTKNEIKNVCNYADGNLKNIFFSKLENPQWFEPLNRNGLLLYSKFIEENGKESYSWPAIPYLKKITEIKLNDVFTLIQSILEDAEKYNNINSWVILNVLGLAIKMPDKQFAEILNKYYKWLKSIENIDWFNEDDISAILNRASKTNKELAIDIIKQFLSISVSIEERVIPMDDGKNYTYHDTIITTKMKIGYVETGYIYAKILKIIKNISVISPFEFFNIFSDIYIEMFKNLTEEQIAICEEYSHELNRSCIEYHIQDAYKQDTATYMLVSAIRDSAISVLENKNKNEIEQVFISLNNNYSFFKRIILHLLRVSKNYDKILLDKYILDYDLFKKSAYIYEYFHLIQDKFNELSNETKDKILNYIEEGPKEEWYQENNSRVEHWKWRKLQPIKGFLTEEQKQKYKDILSNETLKIEHPDFNFYMEHKEFYSPIEKNKIEGMSAEELIECLKKYELSNNDSMELKIERLAFDLQTEVKKNPNTYINILDKFKIINSNYILRILSGLNECGEKTKEDWGKIVRFGKWIVEQNTKNWQEVKKELARLLSNFFLDTKKNIDIDTDFLNMSFKIFKILSLEKDEYLNEKHNERNDYYFSAINSMHGVAFEGLIYYGIWMKNNNKTTEISNIFDKLLTNGKYLETWAVFGRLITWINNIEPKWTTENINKVFPINDRSKFDAAWIAHINYGKPSGNLFPLLRDKYEYVLNNNIYKDNETEREQIGIDIASYYAWGKVKLKDDIMKDIISKIELSLELKSLIKCIGLSSRKGINDKIVSKFVKLWGEFLKNIKGNEDDYKDILKEFGLWYNNELFDRKWIIEQLYKITIDFNIVIDGYYMKNFLTQDLHKYPRKTFEIVRKMAFNNSMHIYDIIEPTVKYITENICDDKTLKADKNNFINKFLESRTLDVDYWMDKLIRYANE